MRPTDENQGPSTRPNLMSSRRGAGEENILAMLERDSARRSGTRMSSSRLAWYGAAAAFSGILVGVVAWLVYDNHETASALQVQVQAERVPEIDAVSPPALLDAPHTMASAPPPQTPNAAVIVDQPPGPAAPPPLVMLPPEPAAKAKPPAPPKEPAPVAARPAPATVAAAVAASAAAGAKAAPAAAKPVKTSKAEKADRADTLARADKPARPAARVARAGRPGAAKAGAPARTRGKAAAPAPAEAAVDTDVALISAIIQHSERHRGEREQPAPCTGPKCPPPPRP